MVDDAAKVLQLSRDSARAHRNGDKASEVPESENESMILVGDMNVTYSQPAAQPQAASQPAPATSTERRMSGLAKLAAVAGLLTTGVGVGSLPWLYSLWNKPAAVTPDTDTDSAIDFEIVE